MREMSEYAFIVKRLEAEGWDLDHRNIILTYIAVVSSRKPKKKDFTNKGRYGGRVMRQVMRISHNFSPEAVSFLQGNVDALLSWLSNVQVDYSLGESTMGGFRYKSLRYFLEEKRKENEQTGKSNLYLEPADVTMRKIKAYPLMLEALETLTAVIGLTPIAGNKAAVQAAFDQARAAITAAKEE